MGVAENIVSWETYTETLRAECKNLHWENWTNLATFSLSMTLLNNYPYVEAVKKYLIQNGSADAASLFTLVDELKKKYSHTRDFIFDADYAVDPNPESWLNQIDWFELAEYFNMASTFEEYRNQEKGQIDLFAPKKVKAFKPKIMAPINATMTNFGGNIEKSGAKNVNHIPLDVLAILSCCSAVGNKITLPGQMDANLFKKVDETLKLMGGQWKRKHQGYIFKIDIEDYLDQVLLTGEVTKPEKFGFFPTPRPLAERVIELANIQSGDQLCEPEAGVGGLADIISEFHPFETLECFEIQEQNVEVLREKGYSVEQADFLTIIPEERYDKIIMNPPFEKEADIDHVLHAMKFLKPGGTVTAIMSGSTIQRQSTKAKAFQALLANGHCEQNPEGSFKASGTAVSTITIQIQK